MRLPNRPFSKGIRAQKTAARLRLSYHYMIRTRLLSASLILGSLLPASAAKYDEMDYGRFLSATYLTQEHKGPDGKTEKAKSTLETKVGCATNKGIAVKLGNNEGGMLFDTDLCRMSGGWNGGYLKYKGVVFDGGHGPNPGPADNATMFFQINPGPGWSKGDDFADPRKLPTGPGAAKIPFGPLPTSGRSIEASTCTAITLCSPTRSARRA